MNSYRRWLWFSILLAASTGCREPGIKPRPEAARRSDEREKIAADFRMISQYYKSYTAETKEPATAGGFWKHILAHADARSICEHIKQQRYAIRIPDKANGIIGYEKDGDYENTHVVVQADGTVNTTMPEDKLLDAITKMRQ